MPSARSLPRVPTVEARFRVAREMSDEVNQLKFGAQLDVPCTVSE
jgi:hypothetical protein